MWAWFLTRKVVWETSIFFLFSSKTQATHNLNPRARAFQKYSRDSEQVMRRMSIH